MLNIKWVGHERDVLQYVTASVVWVDGVLYNGVCECTTIDENAIE